jgi:putative acetyltransferase
MIKLANNLQDCPWAVVRILPKCQRYIVGRYRNRQDAHDSLRLLQRFIPAAVFELIFDPAVEQDLVKTPDL